MKVLFQARGSEFRVGIPSTNMDLFALSDVLEREGFNIRVVTPEVAVFDCDGSEVSILRKGELVIKDADIKGARSKASRLVVLLSQSLGIDMVLED